MSKRIKICFFVPFYPLIKGGAEYQSKILANSLSKDCYEIFFVSYNSTHEDGVVDSDGYRVYTLKISPTRQEKLTFYASFFNKVKKILETEKCNLIYQRVLNSLSFRASIYAKENEIPYLVHIADNYSIEFAGIKGFFKKLIFKKTVQNKTRFIVQTELQMSVLEKFVNPNDIEQVSNMHPILNDKVGRKNKKKVLWIGNSRPVKQLEVFIELSKDFIKSDLKFIVIGNLPDSPYGKFLFEKMQTAKNLEYLGVKDNNYINKLLFSSGLLVNTSISEGFSNTFIQAWMAGTPVLSLNSNPDNLFDSNSIGYFCDGDKVKLTLGLNHIINSEVYQEICENCLNMANEKFGLEKNALKFERIIMQHTTYE